MKHMPNKWKGRKRKQSDNPQIRAHTQLLEQVMNMSYNSRGLLFIKSLLGTSYKQVQPQSNKDALSTQNNKGRFEQKNRNLLRKRVKKINNRKKIRHQQTPQKEQLLQNTKNEIKQKAQRKKKRTKRLIKKSQLPKGQTKLTRSKTSALSENTQPAQKKNIATERHAYIKVETSQRLNALLTCLKAMQKDKMKLVVIVNYSSSVKFYEELLHHLDNKLNALFLSKRTPGDEASFTMEKFQTSQSATLFCTPSIAAKLKIEGPHLLIQFDPPLKVKRYISRLKKVGKTKGGKTLIFLHPKEVGLVSELRSTDIPIIDYIPRGVHPIDIEKKLDLVMKKFYVVYLSALNAYRDFLTSYKSMDSEFLKLSNLSIKEVGKSFGFQVPPFVNLEENTREKWKREMDEKKERTKKRRTIKLEKVYVHIR